MDRARLREPTPVTRTANYTHHFAGTPRSTALLGRGLRLGLGIRSKTFNETSTQKTPPDGGDADGTDDRHGLPPARFFHGLGKADQAGE